MRLRSSHIQLLVQLQLQLEPQLLHIWLILHQVRAQVDQVSVVICRTCLLSQPNLPHLITIKRDKQRPP